MASSSSDLPPGNLHLSQAMLSALHQRRRDAISLGCLTSPPPLASPAMSMPAMSPQGAMPWSYFMPQSMPATPANASTFPLPEMTTPADTFAHDAFPWHASETPAWSADFAPPPASTTMAASASVDASSLDYLQSLLLPAWTPTVTAGPSSSSAPVNAGQQMFASFRSQMAAFDPLQAAVVAPSPALDDVKANRSPAKVLAYQGRVREQRAAVSSTVEALRSAYRGPQHQDPLGRRVRSILAGGADTEWRTEEWAGFGSSSSSADTSSPSNSGSPAWPPTPSSSSSSSPSNNNASSSSNPHSPPNAVRGHKRARSATSAISPPAVHFGGGQDLREYKVAIRRLQQNAHKHRLRNRDVQEMTILCDTVAFVLQQQRQEREQSMNSNVGSSAFFAASPTSSPSPSQRLWDTLRHILLLHRSEWALLVAAERRLSQAMKLERQKQTIGSKRRKAVVAGGAGADVGHATDAAWLSWLAASGGSADGHAGMMAGTAGEGEASSVEYGSVVAGALKRISEVL